MHERHSHAEATSLLLLVCFCVAAFAQTPTDATRRTPLLGTWSGAATRSDGVSIKTTVEFNFNGSFAGSAEVDGQPFWTYEGTWTLTGNDLTWTYVKSSRPIPNEARVDTDELIALDGNTLTLRSKRTGRVHNFNRARKEK